jgi:hypothetical protein
VHRPWHGHTLRLDLNHTGHASRSQEFGQKRRPFLEHFLFMYFVSYSLPSMSSKGGCPTTSSPNLNAPRADQDPLNYDDRETVSEILELISCSDSCHSEAILSEILPELRTIEGSSRLFSAHNKLYPLPLGKAPFKTIIFC